VHPDRDYLTVRAADQFVDFASACPPGSLSIRYNLEWLAVLKATERFVTQQPTSQQLCYYSSSRYARLSSGAYQLTEAGRKLLQSLKQEKSQLVDSLRKRGVDVSVVQWSGNAKGERPDPGRLGRPA